MNKPAIPDYELLELCGCGAFGDVWRAKDRYGALRAIKALDKSRLRMMGALVKEERGVSAFRRVAPEHENLLEIYHIGETPDCVYYVMELADDVNSGKGAYFPDSLSYRLSRGPLPPCEVLKTMRSLLAALSALHGAGLVHRDIKPSNILYCNGVLKVADFGLVSSDSAQLSLAGTPGFIPPLIPGTSNGGPDVDLYAAGKVLYCALTGLPPERFPAFPSGMKPTSDPLLQTLNRTMLKACAAKASSRFSSAEEFMQALEGKAHDDGRAWRMGITLAIAVIAIVASCYYVYWHRVSSKPIAVENAEPLRAEAKPLAQLADNLPPVKNEEHAVDEGKLAEEKARALRTCNADLDSMHPKAALEKLKELEASQPKSLLKDPEFAAVKKRAKDMAEQAADFGGDKTYAKVAGVMKLADSDPAQALREMDALWADAEAKHSPLFAQLYAQTLVKAGRKDDALAAYRSLPVEASKNLKSSAMLKARAEFLWGLGLRKEAAKDIVLASCLNPKDSSIRIAKTLYISDSASLAEALSDAEAAIRAMPDSKSVIKLRDSLLKQMQDAKSKASSASQ